MRRGAAGDTRAVVLRFRAGGMPAELRGEITHWHAPLPLEPSPVDGVHEARAHLGSGVYAYKFRTADGAWHLDPENPRTRSADGQRNSVLSIGGTDEPVLHAPAPPFVFRSESGLLCVRAGLRRDAGAGLSLRWFEEGEREVSMHPCAEEDEHVFFEARIPVSSARAEYLFVLPDGRLRGAPGGGGQALRVALRALPAPPPAWWRDAVLYTIFVDRFRRGDGPGWPQPEPAADPDERRRCGGDLAGIVAALPYLSDLGVTALHLTPVAQAYSAHRYDAVNPAAVDPALGGEPALRALLLAAHRRGIRVLLDLVLTHVHRDFLPFCDVRLRGTRSPFAPWFQVDRHPFFEGTHPGYRHYQKGQWQEPLFNLEEPEVVDYLTDRARQLIRLGADGLRIDAAADVPLPLLRQVRAAVQAENPDAVVFGELTADNLWRYTADALDTVTDFGAQQALYDWLWRRQAGAGRTAAVLARRALMRGGPGAGAFAFTATHDQPRFLTLVQDPRVARLAHLVTLVRAEIPALYYGDEVGLRSAPSEAERAFEDAWPDRQPMPWDESAWDEETLALFRSAIRLRRTHAALRTGTQEQRAASDAAQVLFIRRSAGEEVIELYANGTAEACAPGLEPGAPSGVTALLALGDAQLDVAARTLRLGAWSALVVRRHLPAAVQALWGAHVLHNRERAAAAFRTGELAPLALPTHLYLTVTERCNLRCQHCITEAPQRTAEGRARTMQPWLLDRLDAVFAAAEYFAFSHGGESLVAPIFWDALQRIRTARAGRPYDVHLLTNGMLLTPERTGALLDLGVTSLAVSIDGATAAVNDRIRTGARLEQILRNVESAVALRAARGAPLRIGISTVVTRSNQYELTALGELAIRLGVDWLKLEEVFPIGGFARRELLPPGDPRLTANVHALRERLTEAGIVLVDHLAPPSGCPCAAPGTTDADAALQAFRRADDFANRTRFLPCRMAWTQACVDPDGTVHPVDFFQPALGNLLEQSFLDLWQGPRAAAARARALTQIDARIGSARRRACPH